MLRIVGAFILGAMLSTAGCVVPQASYPLKTERELEVASFPSLGEQLPAETRAKPLEAAVEESLHLAVVEPRKVIYTGKFEVLVSDVKQSVRATKGLAEKMGGYMQRMTENAIVIRVPAEKFDRAVAALDKMGTVTRKDITAQDVTERYTDLQIRLKNARALLEKLQALLDKAQTVKEALEVEREIARVTTEIERLEGQTNALANRIAFATLSVAFTPISGAPEELKIKLPFWWLRELGIENLLSFRHEVY